MVAEGAITPWSARAGRPTLRDHESRGARLHLFALGPAQQRRPPCTLASSLGTAAAAVPGLSLIHISEPTRLALI
eukprot:3575926-Alexandrium_andersonii.AAC.1